MENWRLRLVKPLAGADRIVDIGDQSGSTDQHQAPGLLSRFGLEAEVVDATRAKELWPLIEADDVIGAVGPLRWRSILLMWPGLSKGAKARGVEIFEDTRVKTAKEGRSYFGVEVGIM